MLLPFFFSKSKVNLMVSNRMESETSFDVRGTMFCANRHDSCIVQREFVLSKMSVVAMAFPSSSYHILKDGVKSPRSIGVRANPCFPRKVVERSGHRLRGTAQYLLETVQLLSNKACSMRGHR